MTHPAAAPASANPVTNNNLSAPRTERHPSELNFSLPNGLQLTCRPKPDLAAFSQKLWSGTPGIGLSALQARAVLGGAASWSLVLNSGETSIGGAVAVVERGRVNAGLTVTMVNDLPGGEFFIAAVERFAAKLAVTSISFELISSTEHPAVIPPLARETVRYCGERLYVVDTTNADPTKAFSTNTRRNINKAKKGLIQATVTADASALKHHAHMSDDSMSRREKRGESVAMRGSQDRVKRLLASGDGRLFQAVQDEQVLSSKLVFVLGRHGYYYDGGTSPEGMTLGASHFLMAHIIETLHAENRVSLNLEIASAGNLGLMRYKEGFGSQCWFVERVSADRSSAWRKLRNIVM